MNLGSRPAFLAVSLILCLVLSFSSATVVQAQESESTERETLAKPIELPPPVGLYEQLQGIPERVRHSMPFARALSEMTRKAGANGEYDVDARIRAFEQSQQDLLRSSVAFKSGENDVQPFSNPAWTNIGLITDTVNNPPKVFGAGCTTAIVLDPTNPSTMYVGATSGGVWKSTDAGAHWRSLTDLVIPNQSVASLAIDPKHHNTIYVGTGNGYASVDELSGTGLYKSEDGGGTWTRIGSPTITGTVIKVFVDPLKSNVIFASLYSTNRGVYRSTDSGNTWTKVFPSSGNAAGIVWDIVAGGVISNIPLLYFAEGNNPGGGSQECGLYKSVDDGATWSKFTTTALPRGDTVGRCSLAASVAHPERVFALIANPSGDVIGKSGGNATRSLFMTTNNGLSWSSIAIPSTLFSPSTQQPPQGWYDCVLGVTPNSASGADTIYIAGIEAYVNYSDGNGWLGYCYNNTSWAYAHVDHHSLAFNPTDPSIVYDGCDGGLYWSNQAGFPGSWSYRSNQMITNRFYHVALDKNDSKTSLIGAQDQGTWSITTGGSTVNLFGGDGMQPQVYLANTNLPYYVELPNGDIYKKYLGNWVHVDPTIFTDYTDWNTPFKMSISPLNGILAYHVLYLGRQHLWLSTDDGTTWDTISSTFNDNIHSIGLSQVDAKTVYVGTRGEISVTTDGGSNWSSTGAAMPSSIVSSIVTTGRNTNFALASFYTSPGSSANRVMRTTDKGAHWSGASGTSGSALPLVGVNCVAVDSIDPLRIWYAATDNGIYYTIDSGAHWSIAGAGLGLAPCRDVQIQANKTTIRVATFGRGLWEANTTVLPVELSSLTYQKQFDANHQGTGVNLLWHTDSEHGDAYFAIERSVDGAAFEEVARIPTQAPNGNSSTRLDYSYFDASHASGTYLYQLKQVDLDGSAHFSNAVELHWGTTGLIVSQNYPNPLVIGTPSTNVGFNPLGNDGSLNASPWPETRIHYELPDADVVTIKVYNSTGKLVRTLLDHVSQNPGDPDAFWDGRADDGAVAPSGAYFYSVETEHNGTVINKMVLFSN